MRRSVLFISVSILASLAPTCIIDEDENSPPSITTGQFGLSTSAVVGTELVMALHVTDRDGDPLAFTLLDHPGAMAMTDSVILWTPTLEDTGENALSVQVTDGKGGYDTASGTIMVRDSNHAPVFIDTEIVDTISQGGRYGGYIMDVVDNDHEFNGLRYTIPDSVPGASLWNNHFYYDSPASMSDTAIVINVQVSDGLGKYDTLPFKIYIDPSPVFHERTPSAEQDTICLDSLYTTILHVSDGGSAPLKFSFLDSAAGMVLHDSILTWTPTQENIKGYRTRVKVQDPTGNSDTLSWVVHTVDIVLEQATATAGFGRRYGLTATEFNGKIWVIGGGARYDSLKSDVWNSADGITWYQVRDSAGFAPRNFHATVVFKSKLWVIGGKTRSGYRNDVWYSSDGANWIRALDTAAFLGREKHAVVVYHDTLWLVGGERYGTGYNDVWYTTDGFTWQSATTNAAFTPRFSHNLFVHNDQMWMVGGYHSGYNLPAEVWRAANGGNWSQVTASTGFAQEQIPFGLVVFKNKVWVTGKYYHYSTTDGQNWRQGDRSEFTNYYNKVAVVHDDRIWVMGGDDDEVWWSTRVAGSSN